MDFEKVVKKRYMCRKYKDKNVPDDLVNKILDLAKKFPSAGHTQPQEFILIRDQKIKDDLASAALGQEYLAEAPVVIAVVSDTRRSATRYGDRGRNFYSIIDGAFASMIILLSVVNEKLGAGFVAAFDDKQVQKVLQLPDEVRPIGIIPIGYCDEEPKQLERRPKKEIIHHGGW